MSITLRKRINSDGTTSLRLDIYQGGKRWPETLSHLKLSKVSNLADRQRNKEKLEQAKSICLARALELEASGYNVENKLAKNTNVISWMEMYINTYNKKDKRNMTGAKNRFVLFLTEQKKSDLVFGNLTSSLVEDFIDFLQFTSTGEGPKSYYYRFKKIITTAYKKRMLSENIFDFVEKKVKGTAKKKDVLTLKEIEVLAATPIENPMIRKAFLFSCITGLAWIDIKKLTWKQIKKDSGKLELVRSKGEKDNMVVVIPLNATALKIIASIDKKSDHVFILPSANGANKTVKAWVKRAKIEKAISWHNARHSYGTNLILNEVDVYSTSKLMGHQSLKHTQRYIDAAQDLLRKGTEKINLQISY